MYTLSLWYKFKVQRSCFKLFHYCYCNFYFVTLLLYSVELRYSTISALWWCVCELFARCNSSLGWYYVIISRKITSPNGIRDGVKRRSRASVYQSLWLVGAYHVPLCITRCGWSVYIIRRYVSLAPIGRCASSLCIHRSDWSMCSSLDEMSLAPI